ncbi:hypothetical protein V498_08028, partial [Pseudogymnoascus sp. VKM F-4517 (FW-2822)]
PKIEIERVGVGPDLLTQLMAKQTPLPETEPPSIVTTSLFRHQKQALTFMLRREQGWDVEGNQDIWTKRESQQGYHYYNNVSGGTQHDPPPQFRGGLLADDMGLGKSLSMISLIAANQFVTTTKPYSKFSERITHLPRPKQEGHRLSATARCGHYNISNTVFDLEEGASKKPTAAVFRCLASSCPR